MRSTQLCRKKVKAEQLFKVSTGGKSIKCMASSHKKAVKEVMKQEPFERMGLLIKCQKQGETLRESHLFSTEQILKQLGMKVIGIPKRLRMT